ncbi:TonB-dependent receptor [Sphingopyxis macrogoltabida]|nr:TonB-dependent receptor [Sphingopyxis macrogoltabida]ALJ14059.1 hypothetical protein LH19_14390 [Sphingopyxis macrogoltabida]
MRRKYLAAMLASTAAPAVLYAPMAQAQTDQRSYDIAPQRLSDALRKYSEVSGREVIHSGNLTEGKRSGRAQGRLTPDAALTRLLSGTGLIAEVVDGALVIREGNGDAGADLASIDADGDAIIVTGSRIRGAGPIGSPVVTLDRAAIEKAGYGTVQQMLQSLPQAFGGGPNETVSGTTTRNGGGNDSSAGSSINLRGLGTSSTLVLIDGARPAIGGIGGVFADISLIPVNAIDRVEVLTDGASAIYGADAVAGVVNIRMRTRFEGAETLVRAGTADGDMGEIQVGQVFGKHWGGGRLVLAYQFSDRSALPGSKRDFFTEDLRPFGGPDYRSLYAAPGTITAANGQRFGIPQGQDGRALAASALLPGVQNKRDQRQASDILPHQRTHSLYAAGEIAITDGLTLRANILAAQRRFRKVAKSDYLQAARVPVTNPFYVDPIGTNQPVTVTYSYVNDLGPQIDTGKSRGLTASAGLEQEVGRWRIQLGGAFGTQKSTLDRLNVPNRARLAAALADTDPATAFNIFGNGTANNPATVDRIRGSFSSVDDFESWSAALRADGPLLRLPGGDVRLAIGAEYRRERYDTVSINDISALAPSIDDFEYFPGPRHVRSTYAELLVPIFGPDNAVPGFRRLDLTLAGRLEDYSDVGRTANPKFGVRWEPVAGIALRGSYGTSFRAPAFDELVGPAISLYTAEQVPDPASPTGVSTVLALFGYAPGIGPEKATTWTAGFDVAPPSIPGLKATLTYYEVDYKGRIGTASEDYTRFLANRDLFAGVIQDNPPLALVQSYFDAPTFFNVVGAAPTDIVAILDGQIRNLSREQQKGLDFDLGYAPEFAGGTLEFGLGGTHIFSIRRQLTPGAPAVDVVGTYANPAQWRLRGRLGWSKDGFSVGGFVNYIDGYWNQTANPVQRVPSWTTVDLNVSQKIGGDDNGRGLSLGLSVLNLFDKDPPLVFNRSNTSALAYDPEKASPIGRSMAIQAVIRW